MVVRRRRRVVVVVPVERRGSGGVIGWGRGGWTSTRVGYAGDGLADGAADGGGAGRQLERRVAVGAVN